MSTEVKEVNPSASSNVSAATPTSSKSATPAASSSGTDSNVAAITGHVATISTAVSTVVVAGINLSAEQKKLEVEREKTRREELRAKNVVADGENAFKLQQDKQTYEANAAKERHVHEAAESAKQLAIQTKALEKDERKFDKSHALDVIETNEAIATSQDDRAMKREAFNLAISQGKVPESLFSSQSMWANRGVRGNRGGASLPQQESPQPKGPSM